MVYSHRFASGQFPSSMMVGTLENGLGISHFGERGQFHHINFVNVDFYLEYNI